MKHYSRNNNSIELQFEQIHNYLATAVKTIVRKSKITSEERKSIPVSGLSSNDQSIIHVLCNEHL